MALTRLLLASVFGALLCACETTATGQLQSAAPDMTVADVALAKQLGATCNDSGPYKGCILGNLDAGDFYEIDFKANCGSGGRFANIVVADAPLLDVLPVTGTSAKTVVSVEKGNLVCAQAMAHVKDHVAYYYVADITPGDKASCAINREGALQGDCGRGWILAKELEVLERKP